MTLFNPAVWGPHYWFFMHTIAHNYPTRPNQVTKRKYYDFVMNMPLFIPNVDIGDKFAELLDKYPVTPYLDSRDSFKRWMHFIHNKVNVLTGKEEMKYLDSVDAYLAHYKPKPFIITERFKISRKAIHAFLVILLLFLIYIAYDRA